MARRPRLARCRWSRASTAPAIPVGAAHLPLISYRFLLTAGPFVLVAPAAQFVTSVLIVVSTGQLESWVQAFDGCTGNRDLHGIMAPDWTCLPRLSWRLAAFYVLEHGGLLVIVRILSAGGVPEMVTTRHRRHHATERTRSLKKQ